MNRIVRIIAASTLTFGLLLCGTFAFAQKSPAFEGKFKIAEGADLRILDDNIWDYSKDTIPPKWKEIGEDPRDCNRAPQFARLVNDYLHDVFALRGIFQPYAQGILPSGAERRLCHRLGIEEGLEQHSDLLQQQDA